MCQTWAQKHCSNLSIVPYQFQPSSALGSCFQTRRQSQRWRSWRLLLDNLILHSGSRLYFGDIPIILFPKTKPSYHHIWLTQDGSGGRPNPMGACAGSSFTEISAGSSFIELSAGSSFTELEEAADSTALEACAGSSFLRGGLFHCAGATAGEPSLGNVSAACGKNLPPYWQCFGPSGKGGRDRAFGAIPERTT